jgi:hypothetical protein
MYDFIGWLLLVIAGIFITLIVFHVESEKPISYKFTITSVIIVSFCVGYGIHFLMLGLGY